MFSFQLTEIQCHCQVAKECCNGNDDAEYAHYQGDLVVHQIQCTVCHHFL